MPACAVVEASPAVYAETRIARARSDIDKFLPKPIDPFRFDIDVYRTVFPGFVAQVSAGSLPSCAVPRLTATHLLLEGCDLPPISLAELARTRKLPALPR